MQIMKTLARAAWFLGMAGLAQGMDIKDGDQIAVLSGQSFETYCWSPSGYMRLLADALARQGVRNPMTIFLEGQTTGQMLARLDGEVIANKPVYALVIPGTRDYNPFAQKSVDAAFTANLTAIIGKLQAAHIKTVLVTSYASNSNLAFAPNQHVGEHNAAIRALAQEHGLTLIDLVKVVDAAPMVVPRDGSLAAKAVVHQLLAGEVLRTLGVSEAQVAACRMAWLDTPGAIQLPPSVSVNTYAQLKASAQARGQDIASFMTEALKDRCKSP